MALLKISVLDVGHGDFVYAETPFGHRLVIDCGSGAIVPSAFLSKVPTLDELQISHPHTDHFTDLPALGVKNIKSFRCPRLNGFDDSEMGWKQSDKQAIAWLRHLAATRVADNLAVAVGYGFDHTVWAAPIKSVDYSDPNTVSLVTILGYGSFKMLFGADLTTAGWKAHLENPNFRNSIKGTSLLKVSHHGRAVGTCDELFGIGGIYPTLSIISDKAVDDSNRNTICVDWYRQRSRGLQSTVDGLRHVLTTRRDGSIHIQANANGNWIVRTNCAWLNENLIPS